MSEIDTETNKTAESLDFDAMLDDFLNNELSGIEEYKPSAQAISAGDSDDVIKQAKENPAENVSGNQVSSDLGPGEKELMKAYQNFLEAAYAIADIAGVEPPKFLLESIMLVPNYRPAIGKILSEDVLHGWDMLLHLHFEELKNLDMHSSDDEFLNYAEKLTNPNLQFAIVSYVEILIELESCEITYEEKKIKARKRKIEKEFLAEQQRKNERKKRFIAAVAAKNFPIDAERLITNYLKTANKDPKGAYEALTENPAIYAPIQNEKIKPRLFGLIKKGPKDGIRMNKKIGKFMKTLKA